MMILFKRPKLLWPPSLWRDKCSNWIMLKPSRRQHIPSSIHIRQKHFTFFGIVTISKICCQIWIPEYTDVSESYNIVLNPSQCSRLPTYILIFDISYHHKILLWLTTSFASYNCICYIIAFNPFVESVTSFALYIASIFKKRYIGNWN